jgi:hypothetical protein
MILCKNGHPNPDGATYCAVCRVYIDAGARVEPEEPPQLDTSLPTPALQSAKPVVSLSDASLRVAPGSEVTCEIRVQNPGAVSDDYTVELVGEASAWALVDPWLLSLASGETGTAWARFTPEPSAVGSGPVPFQVKVTSRQLLDEPVSVLGVVEVGSPPPAAPAPTSAGRSPSRSAVPGALAPVRGVVHGIEQRVEWGSAQQSPVTIFTFRVECRDDQAQPVALVPVEMRAPSFRGGLSEGDSVEIDEPWKPGETIEPRRVRNLTTSAWFEVKGGRKLGCLFGLVVLVFLIVAASLGAAHVSPSADPYRVQVSDDPV